LQLEQSILLGFSKTISNFKGGKPKPQIQIREIQ